MAVLNKIRQRGLFLIIIIALALFSFVLADLFRNSDALSAKSQNIVATINGKDISREDFLQKVENMQRRLGPSATNNQAMNRVWDQEVRNAVMETQYEELNFTVEKDQMRDILKTALSNNPDFQNEVGLFDENKLNEYIANLKETSAVAYAQWVDYENQLASTRKQQDYFNLVKAGLMGTLAEGKLEHELEDAKVDLKFVQVPFTSIPDSTVSVSKSEIESYVKKNSKQYEVDETRDLVYVEFKEEATLKDEDAIKAELLELLSDRIEYSDITKANDTVLGLKNVVDNADFINANSDIKYNDQFIMRSGLPSAVADSIFYLNKGEIYGPYKDAGYFKYTKVVDVTTLPDSVKARHILIPFLGAQSAGPEVTQSEVEAKKIADSVLTIVKADKSKFADLVTELSSDKGSVDKGGEYDWHPYTQMVQPFRDFTFEGNVGDMDVVKTVFGFHIIEILGQKNEQRAIKVGTLARKIEPSDETIDEVFRNASSFEVAIKEKDFQEVASEKDYQVRPVNGVKILDENIPGVGSQRQIVRWAFDGETKVGDAKRFNISGGYAIVQLVSKNEKGLMSVEAASASVLPILRNEKKAQIIKDRISATTVQDVATAESQSVRNATAVTMKNPTLPGPGKEPLVVGTAFGLNEGETSGLIVGAKGVYMVEVTKTTPALELDNYQAIANRVGTRKASAVNSKLYNALKDAADIEDNRAKTVQ